MGQGHCVQLVNIKSKPCHLKVQNFGYTFYSLGPSNKSVKVQDAMFCIILLFNRIL